MATKNKGESDVKKWVHERHETIVSKKVCPKWHPIMASKKWGPKIAAKNGIQISIKKRCQKWHL